MAKFEDYLKKLEGKESQDTPRENTDGLTDGQADQPGDQDQDHGGESDKKVVIPEKYKDKTTQELVRMHQELESRFGTQGNELGELRSTVTKLIDKDLKAPESGNEEAGTVVSDTEFFADPAKAVATIVENHPAVKAAKAGGDEARQEAKQAAAASEIVRRHPDVDEVFKDEKFRDWVAKTPHRQKQLLSAHQNYDVDAADAVLSDWKEIKAATATTVSDAGDADKNKTPLVRTTRNIVDTTDADNGSVRGRGGRQGAGKTIFRTHIRKLQKDDPKGYLEMLPEIRKAYAEGRVR